MFPHSVCFKRDDESSEVLNIHTDARAYFYVRRLLKYQLEELF